MKFTLKILSLILFYAIFWCWHQRGQGDEVKHVEAAPLPSLIIPFRTAGGTLTTNGFSKTEIFNKDSGSIRGTTSSEIRFTATYRYEIELRQKWNIQIDDVRHLAFVVAPPIRPQLPVAVDSKTVFERTSSGWARFDKWENLEQLRKETSRHLEKLAESPAYIEAAKAKAKVTVEEFVTDWLLKQRSWPKDIKPFVKVFWADEQNIPYPDNTTLKDFLP